MYEIYLIYANTIQKQESPPLKKYTRTTPIIFCEIFILLVFIPFTRTRTFALKKAGLLETEQQYRKNSGKSSLLFRLKAE